MLQLQSNIAPTAAAREGGTKCPYCRHVVLEASDSEKEKELLRLVTRKEYDAVDEFTEENPDIKYKAAITAEDYPNGANTMMRPLHFAVRDHHPLPRIKEIYSSFPQALSLPEHSGQTPYDFLFQDYENSVPEYNSCNGSSWSKKTYLAVRKFLKGELAKRTA